MYCRRYAALSIVPLAMLVLGLVALAVPEPLRGPLVVAWPAAMAAAQPAALMGLAFWQQPLFLADSIGLALLGAAVCATWALAISWEVRRHLR